MEGGLWDCSCEGAGDEEDEEEEGEVAEEVHIGSLRDC